MIYRFANLTLDSKALVVLSKRRILPLARKVVETLLVLVSNAGTVVSKEELMEALWPDGFVEESNLTQNIYVLRRTLRHYGAGDAIETLARRGYRFTLPVSTRSSEPAAVPTTWQRIAVAIVAALLAVSMHSASAKRVQARMRPDAARLYAMGRYYWNLRSMQSMERSRVYFERVIAIAPSNALGYSGLADADMELADMADDRNSARSRKWTQEAVTTASAAVRIDPDSAAAHVSLGMVERVFDNDDVSAEREFRYAIALDPQNALAHQWLGNLLLARGDLVAAASELENAASLQPVSTATYAWLARDYYYQHRFNDAVRYAKEALTLEPTRVETTQLLGLIYEAQHRPIAAFNAFRRLAQVGDACDAQVLIAALYASEGERTQSARILRRYEGLFDRNAYVSRDLVMGYIAAGEYRIALQHLERLRFGTQLERQFFALDPRLDGVRNDSRFASFIEGRTKTIVG